MDKKKPVKRKGATAKKITIKARSKKASVRKKRVAVGNTKTEKKITAQKTVKKEEKKVKVKTKNVKLAENVKKKEPNKEPKKATIKREEETNKKRIAKRTEKKVAAFLGKKVEVKKVTTKLQKKTTAKRIALSEKTIPKTPEKILLLEKEERYPPLPVDILSEEYGKDSIALMIVDPRKLFIYWEIREDTFSKYAGTLEIRLYDITGIDFDDMVKSYVDLAVHDRIGNLYLDVDPEKEFVADIGVLDSAGSFVILARSNRALTPPSEVIEKGILPQRLYETGIERDFSIPPIGYKR